jgi:hypothetical protein
MGELCSCPFLFKIALSIEIGSFHVANSALGAGGDEECVCGHRLSIINLHKISSMHLVPIHHRKLSLPQNPRLTRIYLPIFLVPLLSQKMST